jgi:2-oxoglutarate dehydrogenase E1 component
MGAGRWIMPRLEKIFDREPLYAGRDAAASPAVGLLALHRAQLAKFLKTAFTG